MHARRRLKNQCKIQSLKEEKAAGTLHKEREKKEEEKTRKKEKEQPSPSVLSIYHRPHQNFPQITELEIGLVLGLNCIVREL